MPLNNAHVFYRLLLSSYKHSKFGLFMLAASLIIAASGLSSVLIINDSAKQSYSSNNTLLVPNVQYQVIAKHAQQPLSKADYAQLRKLGFTQLIALSRQRSHVYTMDSPSDSTSHSSSDKVSDNTSDTAPNASEHAHKRTTHTRITHTRTTQRAIDFTGIDTFALIAAPNALNNQQAVSASNNNNALFKTRGETKGEKSSTKSSAASLVGLSFSQATALVHTKLYEQLTLQGQNKTLYIQNQTPAIPCKDNCDELSAKAASHTYTALPALSAIEEASLGNDMIMDIGVYTEIFPNAPLLSLLWMQNPNSTHFEQSKSALEQALPDHLSLRPLATGEEQGELTESFHLNLLAMALLMFVVCLFIVLNAVNLLINSRMPWLKICRQLGIARNTIFAVQLGEVIILTLLCVLLGMLCGLYLANLVSPSVQATLEGLYNVQIGFGRISLMSLFLQVALISLLGSVMAVYIPFKQVDKSLAQNGYSHAFVKNDNPSERTFWQGMQTGNTPFWLATFGFGVVATIVLLNSTQLWLLLIGTACLILAGCSVLIANYPLALKWVLKAIPQRFTLLRISTQQSLVLSRKTKIACCAFFIAATSNIGMNLMVDSFRGATVSWLDSRLASDYYLYYRGEQNVLQIAAKAQVQVTPRFENNIRFEDKKVQQFSYPTTPAFKDAMVFYSVANEAEAWQAFERNNAVFVNQQFAINFELDIGNTIVLPHPSTNTPTKYEIAGIIYDFGSPNKQVLLPISQFERSVSRSTLYAIEANETQINRFIEALKVADNGKEAPIIKTEELLAVSMQAFDDTFVITDGLNIVTLLVAALSLACAIIVLMDDVRPQNMLIRSMGVSALKTQLLALFQYLLLCCVALVFATPFGILLSWVLIFEINYQAFQWTYPLHISGIKIAQIYIISLFVVLAVITVPLFKAARIPLIEDIRWLN